MQLADGRIAVPTLIGTDPETELALLHVNLRGLPSIELGRSDLLAVGDVVLAIGNSLGLSQTVTMGIVSATGRGQLGVTTFENFIQTDAAINIGNSGGALINARGELVGINTAVISSVRSQRTTPAGIGFAIPVNLVRGVMDQLIEHGRVVRGFLGVELSDLSAREAAMLGVDGSAVLLNQRLGAGSRSRPRRWRRPDACRRSAGGQQPADAKPGRERAARRPHAHPRRARRRARLRDRGDTRGTLSMMAGAASAPTLSCADGGCVLQSGPASPRGTRSRDRYGRYGRR